MASLTFTVSTGRSNRRQQNRHSRNNRAQKKTFCKVCFDAGKSEEEYTSHFLKDRPGPNGKVICPTLLMTECRYCHDHGHFKSHCPALEERKRDKERRAKARVVSRQQKFEAGNWMTAGVEKQLDEAVAANKLLSKQAIPQRPVAFTSNSKFAALEESDDEEDEILLSKACPSVAIAIEPQGAWALKPTVEVVKCADLEANLLRKADITAKLVELKDDLVDELAYQKLANQKKGKSNKLLQSWADATDIDDLESQIEELEAELASMDTVFLC